MFNIDQIYLDASGKRFLCDYITDSSKTAEGLMAGYLIFARKILLSAELYTRGSTLIIDTPDKNMTVLLAQKLNKQLGKK